MGLPSDGFSETRSGPLVSIHAPVDAPWLTGRMPRASRGEDVATLAMRIASSFVRGTIGECSRALRSTVESPFLFRRGARVGHPGSRREWCARGALLVMLGGALALLSSLPAAAQTGGLAVRVVDAEQRKPLPGATVVLTNDRGLAPRAAIVAGAHGVALFPVLPIGPGYRIEVSMPRFARVVIGDQSVGAGAAKTLPVALLPERVEHETVQAERSVVELSDTTTSTKFDDRFLTDLPVQ